MFLQVSRRDEQKTMIAPQAIDELHVSEVRSGALRWLNIEHPSRADIEYLRAHFPFHPLDLDDCLSKIQRPKIDEYDDYLFIVLHFPVHDKTSRVTSPGEVDIFVGNGYVVTVHDGTLPPLVQMFNECRDDERARALYLRQDSGHLLYLIIDRLLDYCFPLLDKIGGNLERIENAIFAGASASTVEELSIIRRDIMACRRIIRPLVGVIGKLERYERVFSRDDLDVYWSDLSDHVNRLIDILEGHRDTVESLSYTNDSLISHRTNEAIKILTVFSTIMLPLGVIAGIYGMNVAGLPLADHPYAFPATGAIMVATTALLLGFFHSRKLI